MLDDLVLGFLSTTSNNQGITSTKDGDGVLANVTEPDVGQGARTHAVNTLERIGTDDDVGDGSAVLEDEDGIAAASVLVRVTWLATVKLLVRKVDLASDGAGLGERHNVTGAGGDVEGLRSCHAGDEREECNLRNHGEG